MSECDGGGGHAIVRAMSTTTVASLCALLAAACAAAAPAPAPSQPRRPVDAEQTIAILQRAWVSALEDGDIAAIEAILAPDFINTAADGRVLPRAEELATVRDGTVKFTRATVEDLRVRVFGTTAIATGIAEFAGSFGERPFAGRERFTDVWLQRGGRWQVVASHNSRLGK